MNLTEQHFETVIEVAFLSGGANGGQPTASLFRAATTSAATPTAIAPSA